VSASSDGSGSGSGSGSAMTGSGCGSGGGALTTGAVQWRSPVGALILGCTHYPLLRDVLQDAVGPGVALVDSAEATAEVVSKAFEGAPHGDGPGRVVHFVTGDPVAFAHTAKVIGGVEGEIISLPVRELAG